MSSRRWALDFFSGAGLHGGLWPPKPSLIAQSLNQIDKAYGQNHSILDNCHVRVTFATNDERTQADLRGAGYPRPAARPAQLRRATGCRRGWAT